MVVSVTAGVGSGATIVDSVTAGVGSGATMVDSVTAGSDCTVFATGSATTGSGCAGSAAGVGTVAGVGMVVVAVAGATFFGAGSFTSFPIDGLGLTMESGATKLMEDFTGVRVSMTPCVGADRLGFSALP